MKHRTTALLAAGLAIAFGTLSFATHAQQAPKPETLIKSRQSAFQLIAYQSSRIKASLDGTYNKDEVARAASTIAAVANSGLGSLFPAGTEQGKGWHDTTVKAEFFKDNKRAGELTAEFAQEASELAKVAQSGDAAAVKTQYAKLNRTCKACHDDFRNKD